MMQYLGAGQKTLCGLDPHYLVNALCNLIMICNFIWKK